MTVELLVLVALGLFAVVHVDTFVVLIAFCADENYEFAEILGGHYLGFGVGLGGAVIGAVLAADLLEGTSFLLGFVPFALGLWALWRRTPEPDHAPVLPAPGPWRRVSVVTAAGIGLSGENIAVFVPFFVGLSLGELAVISILYLLAAGGVFAGAWVVARGLLTVQIPRWIEEMLVPITLIVVGVYVVLAGLIAF